MKPADSPTEERFHNDADAINDLADAINDLAGVFNDYESQVKALQHKLIGAESKRDAALRILNEERDRANSAGVRVSALQAEVERLREFAEAVTAAADLKWSDERDEAIELALADLALSPQPEEQG